MPTSANCLFCKILKGDIPATKVYEDDAVYAFRDINPQAPIHILIIPKQHIPTVNDLETQDTEIIGKLYLTAKDIAKKEDLAESGYRLVMNCNAGAGQTVFHIHLHILGGRRLAWPPG